VRHVAAADGCRLAVHTVGDGPPVLCVPGGPGRAAEYLEDLGGLGRTRRLLLLDNRGTGASELPADRSSLQFTRLADDLADVQRELALSPADVLGHSAGCPVALLHAVRQLDGVRRLVLVTPSGRPFGWTPDDIDEIRAQRSDEPWFGEAAEAQAAMDHANPRIRSELEKETRPFWYGRWDERAQTHAAGADRQMSLRANAGFAPGDGYDPIAAREALRGIRAEVLIVVGGRDALTGASVAERFVDVLPKAEVAVLDGAGHFPWVDEPEAFRAAVESFLAH
jgi:pimeloyl-ACP methyl ester carboxylesterase